MPPRGYPDGTHDHKFSESEKFDYDRLNAWGRREYDSLRWEGGLDHPNAFAQAFTVWGFNKYYLTYGKVGI
jgi:hypothetical protein